MGLFNRHVHSCITNVKTWGAEETRQMLKMLDRAAYGFTVVEMRCSICGDKKFIETLGKVNGSNS